MKTKFIKGACENCGATTHTKKAGPFKGHLRAILGLWADVLEIVGVLDMNGYDLIAIFVPYIK